MIETSPRPDKLLPSDDVVRVLRIVLSEFGGSPMAAQVGEKLLAAVAQIPPYDGALATHLDKDFEKLPGARRFLLLFETLIYRGLDKNVAAEVAARVAVLDGNSQTESSRVAGLGL